MANRLANVGSSTTHGVVRTMLNYHTEGINQHRFNVVDFGADLTGVANSATAIQDTVNAAATLGGEVYLPPGRYRVDATILVPSRVRIVGAGRWATKLYASASFTAAPMFETSDGGLVNMFGQAYGIGFEAFTIEDRASLDTSLTPTGRSERHDGIYFHEVDWSYVKDVFMRDLDGYGLLLADETRECLFLNMEIYNCGNIAGSLASMRITASSGDGDATNTHHFYSCRFIYPHWKAIRIDATHAEGARLLYFTNCQVEGGGNGTGGSLGTPFPYDLVDLQRVRDVYFIGCNFSQPGTDKWCINITGDASVPVIVVGIDGCSFNGANIGGGIRVDRVYNVVVEDTIFSASAAGEADFYVEANAGTIWMGLGSFYSANPVAGTAGHFRGKTGATAWDWGDISVSGGNADGTVLSKAAYQAWNNTTAFQTMLSFDIPANYLGTDTIIELEVWGTIKNNTGTDRTLNTRVRLEGTVILEDVTGNITTHANPRAFHFKCHIMGNGAVTNQLVAASLSVSGTQGMTTGIGGTFSEQALMGESSGVNLSAVNGAVILTVDVQMAMSAAASANLELARVIGVARLVG